MESESFSGDASALIDQLADAVLLADRTGMVRLANKAASRLFGADSASLVGRPLTALMPARFRQLHSQRFERFVATGEGKLVGGTPIRVAILRADGAEVAVELTIGSVGDVGSADFAVVGTLRDVTTRIEVERQAVLSGYLQAMVEAAREGVLAVSPDRRVLAVNRKFCDLWNLPHDSVSIGALSPALLAPSLEQVVDPDAFQAGIAWGHEHPGETQLLDVRLRDGRVIQGYAAPISDPEGDYLGRVWFLWDDTERRATEEQRTRLIDDLANAQRAQRFLLDASVVLAHASGFTETLEALAAVAVPTLGDLCIIDVCDEGGALNRVAAVHADPAVAHLVDELRRDYPPERDGAHPTIAAMTERRSTWSGEMSDEFLRATTRDERHFQLVKQLAFTSYMSVPLIANGDVFGTITLVSAGSGRRFGDRDVALAEDLAVRVALVVEKERRYDRQRVMSHVLQASLLPSRAPDVAGLSIAVRYLPGTRDAEVGGDFWDVAELDDGEVSFAIGDVAGHDLVAAATMAQLRSACRALRARTDGKPFDVIAALQQTWDQLELDRIATVLFARLNRATGALALATAGHPRPLIVDDDKAWFPDLDPAAPIGAPPVPAREWHGTLPVGAAIILYSDGLVEDRHRDIDEGTGRLLQAAASSPSRQADVLADHVLDALLSEDRADDVAILVVQRLA